MRKVIYTCLVGKYDNLRQPGFIDESYDYVCFTDDIREKQAGVWQIKQIPYKDMVDKTRLSRYAKIIPHKVLAEYDYSVYLDANIVIRGREFYRIIDKRIENVNLICQVPHPKNDCIYDEIRAAYFAGRVGIHEAKRQYRHLYENHFPKHYGLFENNIILRKHNDPKVIAISEDWWREYCKFSNRDQFSLMYVYWRHGFMPTFLFDPTHNSRNVTFLEYKLHNRRNSLGIAVSSLDKNNFLRRTGRILHALWKDIFIKLYLCE